MKVFIPPYLQPGDTIGITCPAGYLQTENTTACLETLESWGFKVVLGKTIGSYSSNYFSGTDKERREELQSMLDDPSINAILFGRGGYGMSRIIDDIDFSQFRKKPKWLAGFSDITVMHNHIFRNLSIASLHAPMASAFNDPEKNNPYLQSFYDALTGKKSIYESPAHSFNKPGDVKGILVGGNLALLAHLSGTPSELVTKNKILFLEDIGEYIYNIDRMLYQLKRSGKFDKLKGLIIGGFSGIKDTERPFGKSVGEVFKDLLEPFEFPVCYNFPVSHERENVALKIGGTYRLIVTTDKAILKER